MRSPSRCTAAISASRARGGPRSAHKTERGRIGKSIFCFSARPGTGKTWHDQNPLADARRSVRHRCHTALTEADAWEDVENKYSSNSFRPMETRRQRRARSASFTLTGSAEISRARKIQESPPITRAFRTSVQRKLFSTKIIRDRRLSSIGRRQKEASWRIIDQIGYHLIQSL